MKTTASVATAESEEILRKEVIKDGADAWREGKWPTDCPHDPNGLIYSWWMSGYNSARFDVVIGIGK